MATKTHWLWKLQLLWLALALGAVSAFRLDLLSWRPALLGVAAAAAADPVWRPLPCRFRP